MSSLSEKWNLIVELIDVVLYNLSLSGGKFLGVLGFLGCLATEFKLQYWLLLLVVMEKRLIRPVKLPLISIFRVKFF